jgi:predicted MPP superfamily phosphohydrolase
MFFFILYSIPVLTVLWLWWAVRRLPGRPRVRASLTAFVALILAAYVWNFIYRGGLIGTTLPNWMMAVLLLWALVFLPLVALPTAVAGSLLALARRLTRKVLPAPEPAASTSADDASGPTGLSRREMLRTTALALPMLGTLGSTAISIPQKTHFRVRRLRIPVANLPRALEGLTITHLSDTHVGKFTRGRVLDDLVEATNQLRSDLVLMTGDLIDHSLIDLPEALDMVTRFDPGLGLFNIEGNHDLFEGVDGFVRGVRERGVPLLRDQSAALRVRGHPMEILGLSWNRNEKAIARQVDDLARDRDPDAFPVLLAHHPHAFDHAARHGLPLTLAGHTHGGQLMLTPEIGPGPMLFRYWSGLYRQNNSSLVVSNGAGNWFPLRTAAPAEILHLTLTAKPT